MKRRIAISIAAMLAVVVFGPKAFNHWKWSAEVRKSIKAQIAAAPLIEEYRYPRGGNVLKITERHIFFAYSYASSKKSVSWLACVDRKTKDELWFQEYDHFKQHRLIGDKILQTWSERSEDTFNVEILDSTSGAPLHRMSISGQLRGVLPYPHDYDKILILSTDNTIFCIQLSLNQVLWRTRLPTDTMNNPSWGFGKLWDEQSLLELTTSKHGPQGMKKQSILLDTDTGEFKRRLPLNAYVSRQGYRFYRDDVAYYIHIDDLSLDIRIEESEREQRITDKKTRKTYRLDPDWESLVLRDETGSVVFESNDRRGPLVEVIDGLLIWTSKSHHIYNVRDLRSGAEWIFSLGFNNDSRFPGYLQTWGDNLLHLSDENDLICRSQHDGRILWRYPLLDISGKNKRMGSYFIIQDDLLYGVIGSTVYTFSLD